MRLAIFAAAEYMLGGATGWCIVFPLLQCFSANQGSVNLDGFLLFVCVYIFTGKYWMTVYMLRALIWFSLALWTTIAAKHFVPNNEILQRLANF